MHFGGNVLVRLRGRGRRAEHHERRRGEPGEHGRADAAGCAGHPLPPPLLPSHVPSLSFGWLSGFFGQVTFVLAPHAPGGTVVVVVVELVLVGGTTGAPQLTAPILSAVSVNTEALAATAVTATMSTQRSTSSRRT